MLACACGSPPPVPREPVQRAPARRETLAAEAPAPSPVDDPNDGQAPFTVDGIADAVEVAVGRDHTCVRRASGAVACWGAGHARPSGDSTRPIDVAGVTDAVELHAGSAHTCARRRDGSVVCWGDNRFAQL